MNKIRIVLGGLLTLLLLFNVTCEATAKEDYGCQNFVNLVNNVVTGEPYGVVSLYGNTSSELVKPGRLPRDRVVTRLESLAFLYFHDASKHDNSNKSGRAYQLWAAAYGVYYSSKGEGQAPIDFILDGRVFAKLLAEACAVDGYKTEHDPAALIHYVEWPDSGSP